MRIFGNIIWLILGGIESALAYFASGLAMMLTIIGIPFGLQSFKIGIYVLWPFGQKVVLDKEQHGCLHTAMNILVLPRRLLDMLHPHPFRCVALHHHHRNPVRKQAIRTGGSGSAPLRTKGGADRPKPVSRPTPPRQQIDEQTVCNDMNLARSQTSDKVKIV